MGNKIDWSEDRNAWRWVAKAASKDDAAPVLMGVHVSRGGRVLAATDRQRCHVAVLEKSCGLADGLYQTNSVYPIDTDSKYPKWRGIIPKKGKVRAVEPTNYESIRAFLSGLSLTMRKLGSVNVEATIGVTSLDGSTACVQPSYFFDGLLPFSHENAALIQSESALKPVTILNGDASRLAILMPVKAYENQVPFVTLDRWLGNPDKGVANLNRGELRDLDSVPA